MSDNRFPKENRLLKEEDFSRVYREGDRVTGELFVFHLLKTDEPGTRIGIVTPKYIGKAAKRNRVKRIIREAFRKNKEVFEGYDFIVRPKQDVTAYKSDTISDKFFSDFRSQLEAE